MRRSKIVYDVAFSFAEEDSVFVEAVASYLKSNNVKYYYYKEDEISIWGKKLEKHLSPIYRKQSRFCVVFISSDYKKKFWTNFELKKASQKALKSIQEYILPFKLDTTELPEISPTIKYLSKTDLNAQQLADAICSKIHQHKQRDTYLLRLYAIVRYYLCNSTYLVTISIFTISIIGIKFKDHLTPIDTLTLQLHKKNMIKIKGSLCNDGSFSKSQGNGSCSSHGGVSVKKDSLMPGKTMEECRELAQQLSWLPQ